MANRTLPRLLQTPAVILLLFWMLVPLGMTLFFSFIRYVLNSLNRPEWTSPSLDNWRGFGNYAFVWNNDGFWLAIYNSVFIVTSIIILTVGLGLAIAVLVNRSFPGRGIVRVLLISPFFVMPAVNAVLWINMILDPVLGLAGPGNWRLQRPDRWVAKLPGPWWFLLALARTGTDLFPCVANFRIGCHHHGDMAVDTISRC